MKVACGHCGTKLNLVDIGGRCGRCGSVFDLYYRRAEALDAAAAYNEGETKPEPPAAVRRLLDGRAWVVFYRDPARLADVAGRLLQSGAG